MVMFRLLSKMSFYLVLSLMILELLVRAFHLYNDRPLRFVDEDSLNKWVPGQQGYSVYGNRRQVFAKYRINESGYNSYREFTPTKEGVEVALIGDSFIEGFHQDFDNSIGKKMEDDLNGIEVYEYGHSAYDLADQLYTIYKHQEEFGLIDYIIISIRYTDDLTRNEYAHINRQPGYTFLKHSKLMVYLQDIGLLDPVKKMVATISSIRNGKTGNKEEVQDKIDRDSLYIQNFESLTDKYGLEKNKTAFLLDGSITSDRFLRYLNNNNIKYIDYSKSFTKDDSPKTLIYDQHWNNLGRTLIAKLISNKIEEEFGLMDLKIQP